MKLFKKEQALVVIVIVIQLMVMIFWGVQKSGYYVDEFFTFDNAHYVSKSTPERVKLYDADFLTYDEWHEIADLKSSLTVEREGSLLSDPAGYNVKMWVTGQPYMVLLNYVQAVFFEGKLSKWGAISINILLFLLNQIILYRLTLRLSKDRMAAVMAVALYGFSGMAASMTVYVRFYMMVTLWMALYTWLHTVMWQEEHIGKNLIMEFLSVLVLYQAYKDSPLAVIQGVGVTGAFLVGLLLRKRYKQAAAYGVPIIGGGMLYAVFMTDYIGYILWPEKYADQSVTNDATAGLLRNFLTLTPDTAVERAVELVHVICRYLFGHIWIFGAYLLLVTGVLLLCLFTRRDRTEDKDWGFFFLAICPCAFYCVVSVCLDLRTIRYNSSIFPELAVCAAVFVMYFAKKADKKCLAAIVMGIVVLGAAAATAYIPRVENLYRDDKKATECIRAYHGIDSVVVDYRFDDKVMYECLAFAGDDTKVMITAYENVDYDAWSDDVLLWLRTSEGQEMIEELAESGRYTVEEVGSTHESDVYFISRHIK